MPLQERSVSDRSRGIPGASVSRVDEVLRSTRMPRLFLFTVASASLAAACLMTIDESRVGEGLDDERPDATTVGGPDALTPIQTKKDAEVAQTLDDGGKSCSSGLTLCPDDVCYDTTGELAHCGGCNVVCAPNQLCRASACVAPSSCKELLARAPTTPTGVSNLTIGGKVVPAFCDMTTDGGGYTLVFRLSQGQPGDPYALLTGAPVNDEVPEDVTPQVRPKHYVSRALAGWNKDFPVEKAIVRLVRNDGYVLREIEFDAKGSTNQSWFAKNKVLKSPWTDLGGSDEGLFTPTGHADEQRRFFVNRPYNTCDTDEGWLVVHGSKAGAICAYENPAENIRIYYAPGATAHRWSSGVPEAASFAVFAR